MFLKKSLFLVQQCLQLVISLALLSSCGKDDGLYIASFRNHHRGHWLELCQRDSISHQQPSQPAEPEEGNLYYLMMEYKADYDFIVGAESGNRGVCALKVYNLSMPGVPVVEVDACADERISDSPDDCFLEGDRLYNVYRTLDSTFISLNGRILHTFAPAENVWSLKEYDGEIYSLSSPRGSSDSWTLRRGGNVLLSRQGSRIFTSEGLYVDDDKLCFSYVENGNVYISRDLQIEKITIPSGGEFTSEDVVKSCGGRICFTYQKSNKSRSLMIDAGARQVDNPLTLLPKSGVVFSMAGNRDAIYLTAEYLRSQSDISSLGMIVMKNGNFYAQFMQPFEYHYLYSGNREAWIVGLSENSLVMYAFVSNATFSIPAALFYPKASVEFGGKIYVGASERKVGGNSYIYCASELCVRIPKNGRLVALSKQ